VKISGVCTLSQKPFPYNDIWGPLGRVFDAFGFDRCMWGTDWTRAVGLLTYEQGVEAFHVTDHLSHSDRALLMGETLREPHVRTRRGRRSDAQPVNSFDFIGRAVSWLRSLIPAGDVQVVVLASGGSA
jgi:hypothetical protein